MRIFSLCLAAFFALFMVIGLITQRHAEELCESKGGEAFYAGSLSYICLKPNSIIP